MCSNALEFDARQIHGNWPNLYLYNLRMRGANLTI